MHLFIYHSTTTMGAKDNGTCNSLQPTQTAAIEVPASTLQPSKTQPTLVVIDWLLRCNKGAHWFIKFSLFFSTAMQMSLLLKSSACKSSLSGPGTSATNACETDVMRFFKSILTTGREREWRRTLLLNPTPVTPLGALGCGDEKEITTGNTPSISHVANQYY